MDVEQAQSFYPLSLAVRSLFHKLGEAVTALHEDSGVSGGMRAVLESVITGGPQTVPQMARARPVSRQHIQTLVNALLAVGCVAYADNLAHKRSRLVRPTDKGRKVFAALRRREGVAFARLPLAIAPEDLDRARGVLAALIEVFQGAAWQDIVNDL